MDRSLRFLAFLLLAVAGSHAAVPAQVYWQKVLPDTPMPTAISDLLNPDVADSKAGASVNVGNGGSNNGTTVKVSPGYNSFNYHYAATQTQLHDDPNAALFFLQKDLHGGAKMSIRFAKTTTSDAGFLPLKAAESIPFSSKKLPEVLRRFSIDPTSADAKIMAKTVKVCEAPAVVGETRYCATSLESMVDFTTTALGTHEVTVMSTTLDRSPATNQLYTIETSGVTEIGGATGSKTVACHYQPYVYAVFYCHMSSKTEPYMVSMVGKDGTKADAMAVCHTDTSKWNPKHLAFQVLKVKPGTVPVCHFLPEDHVVWVAKK